MVNARRITPTATAPPSARSCCACSVTGLPIGARSYAALRQQVIVLQRKLRREIIVPAFEPGQDRRPIRAETRATLVASIARGRRGIGVTRLRDAPAEWSRQYAMLGLWI